ncbi:MAG: elongation factor 4 [Acidobacteria bacterium]|nr:elongation factor 4 [Acidobacteriota bacterium]MEE3151504.1 translation elongation factor 4 [Acidobacteriota bacterium]
MNKIRNFCVIAHIDHGKSTLADRLIQLCGGVSDREFQDQLLDTMDLERERGITIKSNTITLAYEAEDGETYTFNLIDTPGHVDFAHEVRRSLMSCEGALLLVDATQGVEAQTLANVYLALEQELEILPVINKIDMEAADVDRVLEEIDEELGLDPFEAIPVSAKVGDGIEELLEAIVEKLPAPKVDLEAPLKALIFDAEYNAYRGVVLFVRVVDGLISPGQTIRLMHNGAEYEVEEVGLLQLQRVQQKQLGSGSVGYVIAGIRAIDDIDIGDTITDATNPTTEPFAGYVEAKPVVFSSVFPVSNDDYEDLARALDKLKLNDAALTFQKDSSSALGFGFRCGFLGMLHLDVVQERLSREFDLSLLLTAPSVEFRVTTADRQTHIIENPAEYPDPAMIELAEEPYIKGSILMPDRYVGTVMELLREKRGADIKFNYLAAGRIDMTADLPLAEVLFDFYDRLKTITQGYGSFDYELLDYRPTDLAKVDIMVNGEKVDALAMLVHHDKARARALHACKQLERTIPKQNFKIAIQGAIGRDIIARRTINAHRKDVTAKCYGGDVTRKRKLLEKQKEGKKRARAFGNVEVPQEAFLAVLRADPDES